jgi:hypothetical protein
MHTRDGNYMLCYDMLLRAICYAMLCYAMCSAMLCCAIQHILRKLCAGPELCNACTYVCVQCVRLINAAGAEWDFSDGLLRGNRRCGLLAMPAAHATYGTRRSVMLCYALLCYDVMLCYATLYALLCYDVMLCYATLCAQSNACTYVCVQCVRLLNAASADPRQPPLWSACHGRYPCRPRRAPLYDVMRSAKRMLCYDMLLHAICYVLRAMCYRLCYATLCALPCCCGCAVCSALLLRYLLGMGSAMLCCYVLCCYAAVCYAMLCYAMLCSALLRSALCCCVPAAAETTAQPAAASLLAVALARARATRVALVEGAALQTRLESH